MKKAIVTGAGGFIGGALTKLLLIKGVTVYGVDISEELLLRHQDNENFVPIIADFTKYNCLHDLIKDNDIDVFYHFAWQGVYGEAFKDYRLQLSNATYAADAINEAIKIGCKKFVFAGTYNEIEVTDFLDFYDTNLRYTCIYSGAKTVSEIILKTIASNNNILYSSGLTAMSYGENNRSMILTNVVIRQLINGERPRLIEGNIPYDLIYIDDIAQAFYAIGEKGKNLKSYYVGHRKLKTFRDYLIEIGQIINPNIKLKFGDFTDDAYRNYERIDLNALYNDTGFECKADFKESILKTARWLKEQNQSNV